MLYLIIGLIIVACLLLWVVILIQNPKGGGLSSQFGGSSVTNIIGAKQSVDVVEKATWYIGIAILVLIILSSAVTAPREAEFGPGIEGGIGEPTEQTETLNKAPKDAASADPNAGDNNTNAGGDPNNLPSN